jgi:hypothetical protein
MEMRRFVRVAVALSILGASSTLLLAHHGNAAYESAKEVTIKGIVTEWLWANPHCFLKVDVTDADGSVRHWVIEALNPPDMVRRGWARDSFKPGDEVTVTMWQARNGTPIGRFRGDKSVVLANGRTYSMNEPTDAPPAGRP